MDTLPPALPLSTVAMPGQVQESTTTNRAKKVSQASVPSIFQKTACAAAAPAPVASSTPGSTLIDFLRSKEEMVTDQARRQLQELAAQLPRLTETDAGQASALEFTLEVLGQCQQPCITAETKDDLDYCLKDLLTTLLIDGDNFPENLKMVSWLIRQGVGVRVWNTSNASLSFADARLLLKNSSLCAGQPTVVIRWILSAKNPQLQPVLEEVLPQTNPASDSTLLCDFDLTKVPPKIVETVFRHWGQVILAKAITELEELENLLTKKTPNSDNYPFSTSSLAQLLIMLNALARQKDDRAITPLASCTRKQKAIICGLACVNGLKPLADALLGENIKPDFHPGMAMNRNLLHYFHVFPFIARLTGWQCSKFEMTQALHSLVPQHLWHQIDTQGYTPLELYLQHSFPSSDPFAKYFSDQERFDIILNQYRDRRLPENILHSLADVSKGYSWFNYLMKLVFSGASLEHINTDQLGLAGDDKFGNYGIYRELIAQVKNHNNLANQADYQAFMNWLITLDIPVDFPAPAEMVRQLTLEEIYTRPELANLRNEKQLSSSEVPDALSNYLERTQFLHYELMKAALEYAPADYSLQVLQHWLVDPEYAEARSLFFGKRYYAPNGLFAERFYWNLPLLGLYAQLPEAAPDPVISEYRKRFIDQSPSLANELMALNNEGTRLFHGPQVSCFGRTVRSETMGEPRNHYLKFQRATESAQSFQQQSEKIDFFREYQQALGIEGVIPETFAPVIFTGADQLLSASSLDKLQQEKFRSMLPEQQPPLAHHFYTPAYAHYEYYPYSLPFSSNAQKVISGLRAHARNCGKLWRKEILTPEVLAAFHDPKSNRNFMTLGVFFGRNNQGRMYQHLGCATNHPNTGPDPVNTRDWGDARVVEEINGDNYAPDLSLDPACRLDKNKIRLHELSNTFEGLVLQLARASYQSVDFCSPGGQKWLKQQLTDLAVDLFGEAFSMPEELCLQWLNNDKVLDWTVIDIEQWYAEKPGFLESLKCNRIPPEKYEGWEGCKPGSNMQTAIIRDDGLYFYPTDTSPSLGISYGLFALTALNCLTAKMLSYGMLHVLADPLVIAEWFVQTDLSSHTVPSTPAE